MSRWMVTHEKVREAALTLFGEHGYDATGTATVARHAGVSEMTLFRHFPTKESLLMDDPYDPVIAESVRARPPSEGPLTATVRGMLDAWSTIAPRETDTLRRGLRIVAGTASLHGAMTRNMRATEDAVAGALIARGVEPVACSMVAAAVLAALSAGLLAWAGSGGEDPGTVFVAFQRVFDGAP